MPGIMGVSRSMNLAPDVMHCADLTLESGRSIRPVSQNLLTSHFLFCRGTAAIAPAIALCSNGVDMAKWARAQLAAAKGSKPKSGDQSQQRILQEVMAQTHHTMAMSSDYTSEIKRPRTPVTWSLDGYGLGWYTGYYRGNELYSKHLKL